jgi:type I restriction enzyme S subunit
VSVATIELGNVCSLDRRVTVASEALGRGLEFVGMEHVDPETGQIALGQGSRTGEGKGQAFLFDDRHVLFGKLRPYLRKIALPRHSGCASTELVPLLPDAARLDRGYLFHWVRRRPVIDALMAKNTGARMPRADMSVLLDMAIPLPPLEEQRRIVGLLDRAAEIRRSTDAARGRARAIIPALFLDTFGDPATLLERYLVAEMDQIISDKQLGLVRSTREQPEDGTYGYVRMNSITTDGRVVLGDLRRTNASEYEVAVNELRDGDLLFNTRNSIELVGKMGIYRGPAGNLFNNNIMRIRLSDKLIPEFVNAYFQCPEGRAAIEAIKKGTTSVCAVYYKDLARVRLPVPPLALQSGFAEQARRIESLARALDTAAAKAEAMAAGLSAEVFGQGQAYRRHQPRLRGASGETSAAMVG